MMKPRVIICELKEQNAVHWWRQTRPFGLLSKMGLIDLDIKYGTVQPQDLEAANLLVMSHASSSEFVKLAAQCKAQRCKLWVDLDDDLQNIPVHNIFHVKMKRDIRNALQIIEMADVFTVSTDEMKEAYLHLRTDTHVLPNAIYLEEMASEFNGHHKEQQGKKFEFPLVLWRGGQYGMRDVWENVGDLSKISGYTARNNGTVAWMGSVPPFLDGDLQVLEWVNVNMFFDNLRVLRPDYIWKPLSKTQFNSCKSNIALLEATVAGALCIGGDGTDKWRPAIKPEQIENDMSWKRKRFEEQRKFVAEHFDIEKVNMDRAAILAGLFR